MPRSWSSSADLPVDSAATARKCEWATPWTQNQRRGGGGGTVSIGATGGGRMTTRWSAVSKSPTLPVGHAPAAGLTAADLFTPPTEPTVTLDEKLRRAYFWLVNKAVISPFYDVEFGSDTTVNYPLGDAGASLSLPKQP